MNQKELQELEELAKWMDDRFVIPGTSIRFGLDSVFGLIPGVGDTGTLFVTLYLAEKAKQHSLPQKVRRQMYWNAMVDWMIGIVPLVGDLFDLGWKANRRNIALLRQHIEEKNGIITVEPTAVKKSPSP